MSVTLNGAAFARRVKALYASWELDNTDAGLWLGSQVVVVANGKASEDTLYQKSVALQTWLLGYEFPETVVLLTKDHNIHILASSKKIAILETLEAAVSAEGMTLVTITRNKKDADATNIASLVDIIKGAGETNKIGMVASDYTGKLMQAWTASMTEAGIETVDITTPISDLLAIKDEAELETVASAAALSVGALKAFLVPTIERIIDEEREISHRKLAESTDEKFERPDRLKVTGVEEDACDSCFTPIIQSGGKYSLKPSAQSNDDNLHFGTIVVSLGGRYKSYCSAVTRTYMVDPSKTQENAYKCAVDLLSHLVTLLNPGVRLSELVTKATEFVQERDESLVDHMVSNLGFGMGIEFRESRLLINARSSVRAKAGMVFNLQVGFKNLINPDAEEGDANHTFAVWIGDTVVVGAETSRVLTADATSNPKDVLYYFKEGADAGTSAAEAAAVALAGTGETGYKMRDRGDKAPGAGEAAAEEARRQHQIQIAKKRHDEARRRVLGELGDDPEEEQDNKIVNAYPNPASFPNNIKNGRIYVDRDREAVIVPLYGYMVPFHISTIKSATTSEEGNFMYLRINFNTPGMAFGAKGHNFEDPQATFVRELSFRSRDASNLNATMRSIKELRKRSTARQKEAAEMEDLVVQPKLQVMRNARPPRLTDVQMRPHLGGRKTVGMLEAHSNGLRFMSRKGEQLDIIYANIKHAFFQPAEGELIVLLHFHLRNPIMVGKKAVNDVQVFTEVMEASQNISKNRRGGFDRDEIENEQRERQLRNRLNAEFKGFMTKVESISTTSGTDLEFDVPYRELGFYGVPQRATVFVMPTVHCIVHLVEPPFFVCTLEEVELAYLERVEFSLRNFDMVLVQKDYTKPVMKINTIPMQYLEAIKEYLDSCDILYYEGRANLNWKQIMKPIIEDPKGFFDLGGWDFLDPEKEMLEAAGEGAEIVEEGSEYVPSEDPDEMSSDDYSLEAYSSSSISEGGDDELSEEGLDWDRLAKHATEEERRKEDKKKRKSRTRDTRSPKRRKR